jgi:superfamily II DNA or RNA helicase
MSTPSDQLKSSLFSLKPDQLEVINHVINGDVSFVVATTGFGKTVVMLHAIKKYLEQGTITQAIVTAPASVISHWPAETKKWGLDLDVQALTGSAKDRLYTLANKSQVIVVSLNNLEWLLEQKPISEMIVIDELTTACGKQTRKLANK